MSLPDCASDDCEAFLSLLHQSGDVFEVRALKCPEQRGRKWTSTAAGFFAAAATAVKPVLQLELLEPPGIYCTLNPIASSLLARCANTIMHKAEGGSLAKDADVTSRRWIMLDIDPVRPSGVSATAGEMEAALQVGREIRDQLAAMEGWPQPLFGMSGNGCYLLYRVDLPNDEASTALCRAVLHGLAERFDTAAAKVDLSTFNAGRILKILGTTARKGSDLRGVEGIEDRPHRRSWFEPPTGALEVVTSEQLQAVAKVADPPAAPPVAKEPKPAASSGSSSAKSAFEKCCKYLDKIAPAVEGQKGSDKAYRAACEIYKFGLDGNEARAAFDHYNARCMPPWNEREIEHKLQQAKNAVTAEGAFGSKGKMTSARPKTKTGTITDELSLVIIDPYSQPASRAFRQVTDALLKAEAFYVRTDQLTHIYGDEPAPILDTPQLAGSLNVYADVILVDDKGRESSKPLPAAYASTYLNQPLEMSRLPRLNLFTRNPTYTQGMRLVKPGFDHDSGIYYAGAEIKPRDTTEHLDILLRDFCFRTPADRTNYLAMMLTALMMPRFIGSKPALLLNGNQPELGKSLLAQILAIVRDGHTVETASYNPNDEEFEKRLGQLVRDGLTTLIIDNAKARGKTVSIDSAVLERSITDATLSYRLLGSSAAIRAENSHLFVITANSAEVSRDLFTRCVICNLQYEGDPTKRHYSLADPEGFAAEKRTEILGELVGLAERWKAGGMALADVNTRFNKKGWGNIVGGILATAGEPDFLGNQEEVASEMDTVRRDFDELVTQMYHHQQGNWTAGELAELSKKHGLFDDVLSDGSSRAQAIRLGKLAGRYSRELFTVAGRSIRFIREDDSHKKTLCYRVADESGEAGNSELF